MKKYRDFLINEARERQIYNKEEDLIDIYTEFKDKLNLWGRKFSRHIAKETGRGVKFENYHVSLYNGKIVVEYYFRLLDKTGIREIKKKFDIVPFSNGRFKYPVILGDN